MCRRVVSENKKWDEIIIISIEIMILARFFGQTLHKVSHRYLKDGKEERLGKEGFTMMDFGLDASQKPVTGQNHNVIVIIIIILII